MAIEAFGLIVPKYSYRYRLLNLRRLGSSKGVSGRGSLGELMVHMVSIIFSSVMTLTSPWATP